MLTLISRALRRVEHTPSGKFSVSALFRGFAPLLGKRSLLGQRLEHLGTLPLTTQSSLALVRFNHETLLIGITTQNMTLLASAPESTDREVPGTEKAGRGSLAVARCAAEEHLDVEENFTR